MDSTSHFLFPMGFLFVILFTECYDISRNRVVIFFTNQMYFRNFGEVYIMVGSRAMIVFCFLPYYGCFILDGALGYCFFSGFNVRSVIFLLLTGYVKHCVCTVVLDFLYFFVSTLIQISTVAIFFFPWDFYFTVF